MTRPCWLGRAARNRHPHAIEQASRRWRGGRRDDSARTRRKILISTQAGSAAAAAAETHFSAAAEGRRPDAAREPQGEGAGAAARAGDVSGRLLRGQAHHRAISRRPESSGRDTGRLCAGRDVYDSRARAGGASRPPRQRYLSAGQSAGIAITRQGAVGPDDSRDGATAVGAGPLVHRRRAGGARRDAVRCAAAADGAERLVVVVGLAGRLGGGVRHVGGGVRHGGPCEEVCEGSRKRLRVGPGEGLRQGGPGVHRVERRHGRRERISAWDVVNPPPRVRQFSSRFTQGDTCGG